MTFKIVIKERLTFCSMLTGYDLMPESLSGRGLMIFWWLFVLTTSAFYTANLVAYLTVSLPSKPVNSLDELADPATSVLPLIKSGSNLFTLFKVSHVWDSIVPLWF